MKIYQAFGTVSTQVEHSFGGRPLPLLVELEIQDLYAHAGFNWFFSSSYVNCEVFVTWLEGEL